MGYVLILIGGLVLTLLGILALWVPRLEQTWSEAARPITAAQELLLAVSHHAMTWGLLIAVLGLGLMIAGAFVVLSRRRGGQAPSDAK